MRKKKLAVKRSPSTASLKRRWILLLGMVVVLLLIGFFALQNRPFLTFSTLSTHFSRLKIWLVEGKGHWHQHLVKAQHFVNQKQDTEEQVHFNFYSTLPNMRPIIADEFRKSELLSHTASYPLHSVSKKETALKQNGYFVQLGIFHSAISAERYKKAIIDAGFQAQVVSLSRAKKPIYRVQLGVYANQNQAKIAQRLLQKKGINGFVSKINPE